ncbi:succinylglutamate desuccinylase/aspartoacylase family protein [Taklimakanibacter deserti]|uniref:succinylglutamate desuccinylase/aspartoacylase family protein n=1 Tax=Taklimakanibacter deserti TaxID=2267839 RepID=UPI000E64D13A
MSAKPFHLGTTTLQPGERKTVDLPISALSNHTPLTLPVHAIHGEKAGPVLFLSAVVHGDEILGAEIVRRVIRHRAVHDLAGTLLAVPVVNAFGLISHSRYMPDRRDLNRSFPGSDHGSLASIVADLFMREVVLRSDYGIDLHTAALHRTNLPQIRIAPGEPDLLQMAEAFGPPVILISKLREGTLRQCARDRGVKVLLYEGGEALRFDEIAIRAGVIGILRVMKWLAMIAPANIARSKVPPAISTSSAWLRAPEGGLLRAAPLAGDRVEKGEAIGEISDPFGERAVQVISPEDGIVIGRTNLPIVNRGDALFHIARVKDPETSRARIGRIGGELSQAPLFDEDEII